MTESRVFIVNVWHSRSAKQPPFRASVRAVENPEPLFFEAAADLARFFVEAGGPPPAEPPADDAAR